MADNCLRHHPHASQGTLLTDKVLHRVKLVQYHDPDFDFLPLSAPPEIEPDGRISGKGV